MDRIFERIPASGRTRSTQATIDKIDQRLADENFWAWGGTVVVQATAAVAGYTKNAEEADSFNEGLRATTISSLDGKIDFGVIETRMMVPLLKRDGFLIDLLSPEQRRKVLGVAKADLEAVALADKSYGDDPK